MLGIERATGERQVTYFKTGRTGAEAVRKAAENFARASAEFRAEFDMADAVAIPAEEWEARQAA